MTKESLRDYTHVKNRLVKIAKRFGRNITVFNLDINDATDQLILKLLEKHAKHCELEHKPGFSWNQWRVSTNSGTEKTQEVDGLKKLRTFFPTDCSSRIDKLNFYGIDNRFLDNVLQISPKPKHLETCLVNLLGSDYPFRLQMIIDKDYDSSPGS